MARRKTNKQRRDISDEDRDSLERLLTGWRRTEVRRGVDYSVQPLSAERAVKQYICPGCGNPIEPGLAHLVVWRSGGVLGDAADIAGRRHWHSHCWKIGY